MLLVIKTICCDQENFTNAKSLIMKQFFKASVLATLMLLIGATRNKISAQVSVGISFQTFYDDLSTYGQWINYPEYGYVWQPDDRYGDFRPYSSGGHWAWS